MASILVMLMETKMVVVGARLKAEIVEETP